MAKVRARPETGKLYFDFFYQGARCREQTDLPDTPTNRKRVEVIMRRIATEMQQGTFDYARYFPNSKIPKRAEAQSRLTSGIHAALSTGDGPPSAANAATAPTFRDFVDIWLTEN